MVAESSLLVAIAIPMTSVLLKSVLKKSADALSNTSTAAAVKSTVLGKLKKRLPDLERELTKLNALLCFAEGANPVQQMQNDLVLVWLRSVREAANFADNLLEDISYDQLRRQAESNALTKLFYVKLFQFKIDPELTKFMSMTAKIYKEAAEIGLRPAELVATPSRYQPPAAMSADLREIRENVDTSIVVGRQLDEDSIVRELSRPDNDELLGVIAIVGMSGVGKTTLARKIYDNETVRAHFKSKSWIFVSEDFKLRRILEEMLQSLTGDNHNLSNIDAMEKKLQSCLEKERYLVVLDDVWNTDKQIWDSVRTSLVRITDGCTGSMVLVTTQSHDVASVMGASLTHQVKVLLTGDAWALFENKAVDNNKSPEKASDLRDIGERILRKCGGLPLAISTLGSLLGCMEERSQWESVERNDVWSLPEGQTKIMPWLLLSFNHLPTASVKQCFAYCSVGIPKGYGVSEENLISEWIGQGFIQPSETGDKGMWAMGRKYIKSMLANGLLQFNPRVSLFSMHDLIHDLALYVSRDTCLVIRNPSDLHKASSGVEHLRIYSGNACNSQLSFPERNTLCTLRSLVCFDATISIDIVVAQARFLRQLDLIDCGLKEIPTSIGRLKHLRILELQKNPFEYLPESIGRLYNLQVLALGECDRLVELPQTVAKLLSLRILHTTEAVHIPKGMGQLTCLTELPVVKLKERDGGRIKELRSLLELSGLVVIKQLENISCKEDAMEAGLGTKAGIAHLKLIWTSKRHECDDIIVCGNDEDVMEGLQPHSNLEVLLVENFRGKRFSPWLSNGLYCNRLTDLSLVNCKRCEQLPTLGSLPCLKFLAIDGMESVEVMGSDFFYTSTDQRVSASSSTGSESNLFPQLNKFILWNMPKLRDWFDPSGSCASAFPCLEELSISNCPSLLSVPSCFHSLKKLATQWINSREPLLMILRNGYNLTSLVVQNVQQLTRLCEPLLKCTSLRIVRIIGCKELVELPPTLQSLRYLETLEVSDCGSLTSFPDITGLLSLRNLEIMDCKSIADTPSGMESCVSIESLALVECNKFDFIPDLASLSRLRILGLVGFSKQMSVPGWINHLSTLSRLAIGGFNNELTSLPNHLQSFTQLEKLVLMRFEGVMALPEWLGNLSSLQFLHIMDCKNMKQLPSLDAMRSLAQLRELRITRCPLLEERCSKDGGEDWHKISHLPCILINEIRVT